MYINFHLFSAKEFDFCWENNNYIVSEFQYIYNISAI